MRISVEEENCKGCLACELACSFHHTKEFSIEDASIRIFSDSEGGLQIAILPTCDLCLDERLPLCIEFCPARAIKLSKKNPYFRDREKA